MTNRANPNSVSPAVADRAAPAARPSRRIFAYVQPAAVLIVGAALSVYAFRTMLEWQQHARDSRQSANGAPYIILLGGCILTLFSAGCCGRMARPRSYTPAGHLVADRSPLRRNGRKEPMAPARPGEVLGANREALSQILNGTSIPTFVINCQHVVTHWNPACENLTGVSAREMLGTKKAWTAFYAVERPVMAELVVDQRPREELVTLYGKECRESLTLPGAFEFEATFPKLGDGGKYLFFTAAPLREATGRIVGAIETFQDMTARKRVEAELQRRIAELSEAKRRLEVLVLNTTDREKRMVDLKAEVNDLLQAMGRGPKYTVPQQVAQLRAKSPPSRVEQRG